VVVLELLDAALDADRVALGRHPLAVQRAEDAVGVRLEDRHGLVGALADLALRHALGHLGREDPAVRERLEHAPALLGERGADHAARAQRGVRGPRALVLARRGERRGDRHHGVAERADLGGDLFRASGLVEERLELDRRLGLAHLLERAEMHVRAAGDDAAVAHGRTLTAER
jgi:hypothetical protein